MKDLEKKYCENERGKTESGRKNKATYQKKIPTATPEKYKAKCLVTAGIRNGSIVKQPCSECGDKVVDAHHPDYDKPLDIVWLCRKHHMEIHGKQLHDYSLLSENRKKELRDSIAAGEGVGRGGNRKGAGRPFLPEGQKKVYFKKEE